MRACLLLWQERQQAPELLELSLRQERQQAPDSVTEVNSVIALCTARLASCSQPPRRASFIAKFSSRSKLFKPLLISLTHPQGPITCNMVIAFVMQSYCSPFRSFTLVPLSLFRSCPLFRSCSLLISLVPCLGSCFPALWCDGASSSSRRRQKPCGCRRPARA